MVKFEFYLGDSDFDRLFAIKAFEGEDDLTGNEFAAKLLERELFRRFPATPKYDDDGRLINGDRYRGK